MENLIESPEQRQRRAALEREMTDKLKAQGDLRMFGRGEIFDSYPIANPTREVSTNVISAANR